MIAALTRADLSLYRRLLAQARPYWRHLVAILVLDLTATPLALLGPLPLKIAVDSVVGSESLPGCQQMDRRVDVPSPGIAAAPER